MTTSVHKGLAIARQHYHDGRITKAAVECERLLAAEPRDHEALQLLGVVRLREGRIEEALALTREVVVLAPENAEAHNNLGLILARFGRHDEALASFERALAADATLASAEYNRANALKALGRHDQALCAYDAALALNPRFAEAHNNKGTLLAALGRSDDALACLERAVALAPRYAEAQFNRANLLATLGRHKQAVAGYDKVIALNPRHAPAYNNRGQAQNTLGRAAEALASFERALALKPDFAPAAHNRGIALMAQKRPQEALAALSRALALNPHDAEAESAKGAALIALDRPEEAIASFDAALALAPDQLDALTNRGTALARLNRHDEAIACFDRVIARAPAHAAAHWNRGHSRLVTGDLVAGWRDYEWRWSQPGFAERKRSFAVPQWQGEDNLAGKTVLVHAEQGFGDTIQFCRYVPMLAARGAKVVLEARASLVPLLESLAGARAVVPVGASLPPFDLHAPLMSLPLAFATSLASVPARVPYLRPPPARSASWRVRLDPVRFKIGLAWSGSATHANDRNRSIPLAALAPLIADKRFEFHVLANELRDTDRQAMQDLPNLRDHSARLADFADTAALASELQLVISVDTSLAHLAGALGLPVWLMLPFAPDWRWLLGRADSPWYPSARLFRQPATGDWGAVIGSLARALDTLAAERAL